MKIRAVIFDVYGTLLEVTPAPADAAERWAELCQRTFGGPPRLSPDEFAAACQRVITDEHVRAGALGVQYPEVYWPAIVVDVLPELAGRGESERDQFLFEQAGLWHTVRLMPGAADALRLLMSRGIRLGIASNAQPYTLRELDQALATAGLSSAIFAPEICFWSFAHGYSKPNPHVFRQLAARLRPLAITAAETLMVGDRIDNDIAPARAHGWRTWRLANDSRDQGTGDWTALAGYLAAQS